MTASPSMSAQPHLPDEESLIEYRALSRPAVAALLLGLASPLVLASPLLVVIPAAAAVAVAIAWRSIASSGGQLTGSRLALLGLCLAALFAGWGLTRPLSRQAALARDAQRFANEWLDLVRSGDLQIAHQMQTDSQRRISNRKELKEFYETDEGASESLGTLFGTPPLKSFIAVGPQAQFRCSGVASQSHSGYDDRVALEYRFGPPNTDPLERMWVHVRRTHMDPRRPADWVIESVSDSLPD
jgi:hypothetical protein